MKLLSAIVPTAMLYGALSRRRTTQTHPYHGSRKTGLPPFLLLFSLLFSFLLLFSLSFFFLSNSIDGYFSFSSTPASLRLRLPIFPLFLPGGFHCTVVTRVAFARSQHTVAGACAGWFHAPAMYHCFPRGLRARVLYVCL